MKTPKHGILESNFYTKTGFPPNSCACKRISCLLFKNVYKSLKKERNKILFAGEN
jgi:hypothetical protein